MGNSTPRGFTLIELMVAVTITGVLGALAATSYDHFKCRAAEPEAKLALQHALMLETDHHAQYGRYADLRASCPENGEDPCVAFEAVGARSYQVTGSGSAERFAVIAVGIEGTRAAGNVWQIDQNGALTDVARTCGAAR